MKRLWISLIAVVGLASAAPAVKFTQEQEKARLFRFAPAHVKEIDAALPERELLTQVARDTWGYFNDAVDKQTGLPLDNVLVFSTYSKVNSYTSTTNIGLYMMCIPGAEKFGFINHAAAVQRLEMLMTTLEKLDGWQGQPYNYYETITLNHSGKFVSAVDNGWLAAGLIVIRQAYYKEVGARADAMIRKLNFSKLYDPKIGQLYLGYDEDKKALSPYHYGLLATEPRVASYIGIAKGDLPKAHWYKLFRTIPQEWDWQRQKPAGQVKRLGGMDVFSGYYTHNGLKYVPSWGGSLFEFLMPTLVLDEVGLSPKGLGLNDARAVNAHIEYALDQKKYRVWGMSPCSIPEDPMGYKEYGVNYLGAKGYEDGGVVTPHVSFLALAVEPQKAVANIRKLLSYEGIYGGYGFYDSVNVQSGKVSPRYLSLDQAMTFIALDNHLNDGHIRRLFNGHSWMKAQQHLLSEEEFF
jgi:hypothetical protein